MNTNIQVFDFKENVIRAIQDDKGNPLFYAKDICAALEINNVSMACSRLDEDEKGISEVDTLGGKQSVLMVNESGLYSLIFTSNKPEAKVFRKWVTGEVLPSIRKTGGYVVDASVEARLSRLEQKFLANEKVSCNNLRDRIIAILSVSYPVNLSLVINRCRPIQKDVIRKELCFMQANGIALMVNERHKLSAHKTVEKWQLVK